MYLPLTNPRFRLVTIQWLLWLLVRVGFDKPEMPVGAACGRPCPWKSSAAEEAGGHRPPLHAQFCDFLVVFRITAE